MDFLFGLTCVGLAALAVLFLPIVYLVMHLRLVRRVELLEQRQLEAARPVPGPVVSTASEPAPGSVPRAVAPTEGPGVVAAVSDVDRPTPRPPAAVSPAAVEVTPESIPADSEVPPARAAPPAGPEAPPARPPAERPPRSAGIGIRAEVLGVWALAIPGGLALLLAAIFALREAIAAGFVGPGVRFALGAAVGSFALLASEIARWRRYDIPAAALGGGGAGIVYAVLYAGHARYDLFGQELAFGLMTVTTVITLLSAERRDSRFMATLAMVGGYLTPLLLSTGENKALAFFGYLALLDGGLLIAAVRRRWTTLILLSACVTSALYVGWIVSFYAADQAGAGLAAAVVLGGLYLAIPARRAVATSEAVMGAAGALLLWLCGAIYVFPADMGRVDPVSALPLAAGSGDGLLFPLLYTLFIPPILVGIALRRAGVGGVALQLASAVLGALLSAVFVFGWTFLDVPAWEGAAVVLLGAPALAGLCSLASARALFWPVPAVTAGLLLAVVATAQAAPVEILGVASALAVLFAVLSAVRGPRVALLIGLGASALPLWSPLFQEPEATPGGVWFVAIVIVYAAFAFPPFWRPKQGDLFGALSAALVGAAVFLPFRRLWLDAWGESAIGLLPVLLGGVALVAAVALVRAVRVRADDRELAILVTVVLFFAALAVPLQLSEAWLTVGWAVEVMLLAALSRRLTHPGIRVFGGLLAAAVCVRLLLNPEALAYGGGEGWILLNWTLYTWGVPAVCLLVAARLLRDPAWFRALLRTGAVGLLFALINLEIAHAFAHDDTLSFSSENLGESMTRSIAWGVYGLFLIAVGLVGGARGARLAGLFFALLGAFKVFAIDLWSLSGFARVGSFAGLAITLLVGAVAFQRIVLKDRKP